MDSYGSSAKPYSPYQQLGSGGIGDVAAKLATESSPARDRISSAESWLSDSHQAIDALEKRLDTILTPVSPQQPFQASNTPTPVQSHVVGRLAILNEGYQHLVDRIQRLISRVEL